MENFLIKCKKGKKDKQFENIFKPKRTWEDNVKKEKDRKRNEFKKWHNSYNGKKGADFKDKGMLAGKNTDNENNTVKPMQTERWNFDFDREIIEKKSKASKFPSLDELARRLKEKVDIIRVDNALYYYNGRCYQKLDKEGVVSLFRKKVSGNLYNAGQMRRFYELYEYLLADPDIERKRDLSALSGLAILKNGIYHVKKGKLKKFDPSIIAFSYVDANYMEDAECPKFEEFLYDVTGGDTVLIKRFWMFLGYTFMQSIDAKVFFVMGYASNSGKSLLGKFMEHLYDKQYVSSIALSDFNGEFSMGSLVGAAVNISLDLPNSRLNSKAVSKLKMLTGGDRIMVNEKYIPQFGYQNSAKFIFASNYPLQLVEDDEAFWERLVWLPFDYSVDKKNQDVKLLDKLLKEKDAVVSKALRYAKELMESNYEFPTTDAIERKILEWRGMRINTIELFIRTCCIIDVSFKGELMEDLYNRYMQFCHEKGEYPEARNEFKKYMEQQLGLEHFKMRREKEGNPQSAFRGIELCSFTGMYLTESEDYDA